MSSTPNKVGRIVSQALQPGTSVCVVCGRSVEYDYTHLGHKMRQRYHALCMNYGVFRGVFVKKGECVPCAALHAYKLDH